MENSASHKRVVVTGMGVIASLGHNVNDFWANIVAGKCGIDKVTLFDAKDYSCQIGAEVRGWDPAQHMDPKEVRRNDRYTHFGFCAAKQAIADAKLDMTKEDADRVGVIIGSGIGGMWTIENQHKVLMERGPRKVSPFMIPALISNMCGGLVAIELGARGPNFGVVSACSTATHAIGESLRMIRRGDADVMVCGGAEAAITPLAYAGFCSMKAMSTNNDNPQKSSRPFDLNRDGFIMGEGSAIIVIESLEHALARGAHIYCELAGYAATCDAYHITSPDPDGKGLSQSMIKSLHDANIEPHQVDYINAHGTSTPYNDKFETIAIKKVFGDHARKVNISSTKSMTGHLLGAAGSIEAVISIKAIETGIVPPTINYETPDPDCDLDYTPNVKRAAKIDTVLTDNLGFGGHNAALVFRRH
ncbi:beta-ketoacyl-ACP synthase II [Opitutus sp. GAS368]|uniref:beta-ketoacyl-ACP synthase II n=1 Tax=Opitutus sp. GAS368 TaxID=1882749 RepID=UPI00087C8C54|nr:beta-ketoacyl-ACP synthase II [Opitutus sp. GAS368]SDS35455.1 3-oxoacyl-[acyl-carrier-protein] synthase II [Opitutus sp. GAS368]